MKILELMKEVLHKVFSLNRLLMESVHGSITLKWKEEYYMFKLMKYEIQKIKLKTYIISGIILILVLCYFMLVALSSAKQGLSEPTLTYPAMIRSISAFTTDGFVIWGAVLIARLIVEEYTNKTILVLFSYPIEKGAAIKAKFLIVSVFSLAGVLLGNIACIFTITLADKYLNMLSGFFDIKAFVTAIEYIFLSMIMTLIFLLIPFLLGIWKKSISITVLSSLLSDFIVQLIISQTSTYVGAVIGVIISAIIILPITLFSVRKYSTKVE